MCPVPGFFYVPAEGTALVTPDALRIMLSQAGMACDVEEGDDGGLDIVLRDDQTRLLLESDSGFVEGIIVEVTFVDERAKFRRVCELLEMMGWVPGD